MVFNSMTFLWIFLPVILILYYITPKKCKNLFLLLASLMVYAWGSLQTLPLLIVSILVNYIIGLFLSENCKSHIRKIAFIFGLLFNISILSYFKYYNFFVENLNILFKKEILQSTDLILPLGISFFTFSAISYLFDLFRKNVKVQKNPLNLALYICFFPKLTMGPIEDYKSFEEYFYRKDISTQNTASGIKKFIYGLSKKVIIANTMGIIADKIFNSDLSYLTTGLAWIGAISYMFQIYFDFSGYSDMAIGLGKMFGINMKENFNLPYLSESITEFWRRWHISLSTWFKNYLYIPLGGNRKGKIRTYINLFIVFFTTGLWHGSSWNFVVWGLFNGFFMIIERIKFKELLDKNKFKLLNHIYTLLVILLSWVIFRCTKLQDAIYFIKAMFTKAEIKVNLAIDINSIITLKNIIIFVMAILTSGILQKIFEKNSKFKEIYENFIEPVVIGILFAICIMFIVNGTFVSYIYANF